MYYYGSNYSYCRGLNKRIMPYLAGYAQKFLNGAETASANMPSHQADDILVCYATLDSGTITLPTSGGGGGTWTVLPNSAPANPVSNGIVTYLSYIKATSASETFPSVVWPDAYTCTVYCFRDCYVAGTAAQIFDSVTPINTTSASGYTATSTAITTNTVDSMIVYLVAQETPATLPSNVLTGPGVMWIDQNDTGGTTATTSAHQAAAWYINRAAGACPTPVWTSSVTTTWTKATFALRNKASGRIPAYIDDVTSPGSMITGGHHIVAANNITTTTNGITATINGKTATPSAATNGADFGINPFCNAISSAAAQTAASALVGPEITLTAALDASTGLILGSFIAGSPKMGTFGIGTVADGGVVVRLGSGTAGTTAWNAYQVAAKNSKVTTEQRCVFAIEAGYATSAYASGASNCSSSAVKYLQFLRNAPYFSSAVYAAEIHFVGKQVISGGDSTTPVGISGLVEIGKSFRLPVIQQAGSNGIVSFAPIQIGGGDAVNFLVNASAIQFPSRASSSTRDLQYHASDNKVGLYDAGKSGDTITLTNSVVTSDTPYIFEVTSAATSSATRNYTGTLFVNANVTLRPVMTFTGISFSSCASVATTGSTIQSCTFSNTLVTASSPANAALVSACTFTKTTGTQHAIQITGTVADIVLTNLTFTGYAASNGSTGNEAIYVNIASGTMSITISGGTTPSIRTAGATVNLVLNPVTFSVTVKDLETSAVIQNARVMVPVTSGVNFPYLASVTTITGSGTTATVTHTGHGRVTNDNILIAGATRDEYNGAFTITVTDANTYTYTTPATVSGSPAGGTITATMVLLNGLTNASGIITDLRTYSFDQPVSGWVRKATGSPLYRQAPVADTVSNSTGLSVTVFLQPDE